MTIPLATAAATTGLFGGGASVFTRQDFWQRVALISIGVSLCIAGLWIVVITSKAGKAVGGVVMDVAGVAATKNPVGAVASAAVRKVAD